MAPSPRDEIERLIAAWHAAGAAKELFEALRDPMRRAARRGIRRILAETPDEGDVDDVVFKAFTEFLDKDPSGIRTSATGFACTIADRRGRDRARSIIRERERIQGNAWQIDQMLITESDEAEAAERERLFRYASECMEHLTPEQRDVIERTVQRQVSLSDWVAARGTSYEAGRRLRERGLAALRRCIDGKLDRERGESDG
jgi:DNA-directed RNA polymerase specialized sigma24 family protein